MAKSRTVSERQCQHSCGVDPAKAHRTIYTPFCTPSALGRQSHGSGGAKKALPIDGRRRIPGSSPIAPMQTRARRPGDPEQM
jgi:hypothetical protein